MPQVHALRVLTPALVLTACGGHAEESRPNESASSPTTEEQRADELESPGGRGDDRPQPTPERLDDQDLPQDGPDRDPNDNDDIPDNPDDGLRILDGADDGLNPQYLGVFDGPVWANPGPLLGPCVSRNEEFFISAEWASTIDLLYPVYDAEISGESCAVVTSEWDGLFGTFPGDLYPYSASVIVPEDCEDTEVTVHLFATQLNCDDPDALGAEDGCPDFDRLEVTLCVE